MTTIFLSILAAFSLFMLIGLVSMAVRSGTSGIVRLQKAYEKARIRALEILAEEATPQRALRRAMAEQRGSANTDWVIAALVVFLVAVYAVPMGIEAFVDVDTSTWPTSVSGFWGLLPLLVVIGIVFGIYKMISARSAKGK